MTFGFLFWSAWAVVFTTWRINTSYDRDKLPLLVFILLVYGPIITYSCFKAYFSLKASEKREAFIASAGAAKYSHFEKGSGIAIDPTAGTLTLRFGANTKSYSFADVRDWTNAQSTSAAFIPMGGGLAGGLAAGAASLGAAARAAAETGFFVKVRDVDNPEWRVSMDQKADRDRWSEILEQEINERRRVPA